MFRPVWLNQTKTTLIFRCVKNIKCVHYVIYPSLFAINIYLKKIKLKIHSVPYFVRTRNRIKVRIIYYYYSHLNLVASYQSALQYLLCKNSAALDVEMFLTKTSVCFSLEKVSPPKGDLHRSETNRLVDVKWIWRGV